MVYRPKELPEDINVTPINPLVDFAYLLGTVVIVSVITYICLGEIATRLATRIPPQLETKIGQQLLTTIPTVSTPENLRQRQYLQSLLTSVASKSPAQTKAKKTQDVIPLAIHIQTSAVPNAIIIPGGHIIVTTALLAEAESENELAFVLAHELGHHAAKDPLKGLGRSLVFVTIASVLGAGGGTDLVGLTGSVTNLHYSRQQESTADVYGLSTIMSLYGHGEGSLDFFRRIQSHKGDPKGKISSYLSTHPLTKARIKYLRQIAQNRQWQMTGKVTDLPSQIFEKL